MSPPCSPLSPCTVVEPPVLPCLCLLQESAKVMPVSVDEAYLELAPGSDGVACAQRLRQRIMDATRCPASAGISCNMLLARLATKKAKPNGQYLLSWDDAPAYLAALPVGDLPGVGYDLVQRLNAKSINTCTDLLQYPLPALKVRSHRRRQLPAYA